MFVTFGRAVRAQGLVPIGHRVGDRGLWVGVVVPAPLTELGRRRAQVAVARRAGGIHVVTGALALRAPNPGGSGPGRVSIGTGHWDTPLGGGGGMTPTAQHSPCDAARPCSEAAAAVGNGPTNVNPSTGLPTIKINIQYSDNVGYVQYMTALRVVDELLASFAAEISDADFAEAEAFVAGQATK